MLRRNVEYSWGTRELEPSVFAAVGLVPPFISNISRHREDEKRREDERYTTCVGKQESLLKRGPQGASSICHEEKTGEDLMTYENNFTGKQRIEITLGSF